jgi:hypothetical protein
MSICFYACDANRTRIHSVYDSPKPSSCRKVALWHQRLAKSEDLPVVWDYHCILLLKKKRSAAEGTKNWFYDFDTTLPNPCAHDGMC